jgi:hypothetical protein
MIYKEKKYNYVYKIINSLNGMEYIGVHSTNKLDDNYFGSGTYLKNAIKKHGKENFTKEILKQCNCRLMALNIEKELVKEDYVLNPLVYNLVLGGGLPLLRGRSILKYKKEIVEHSIKIKNNENYNIDIDEESRLKFTFNERNILKQKVYLSLYEDQINKKYGNDLSVTPYHFSIMLTRFLFDNIGDTCDALTKLYNDKRHNKLARNVISQLNAKGFIGDCIEIKGLNTA